MKNRRYYFEQQFAPYAESTVNRIHQFARNGERFDPERNKNRNGQGNKATMEHLARRSSRPSDKGANLRSVWRIPAAQCKEDHFAVFPEKLIVTPIMAGCPTGGIVLDPFSGAGTTGIVCERLGRSFLGIELNPAYVEIAMKRIREARVVQ